MDSTKLKRILIVTSRNALIHMSSTLYMDDMLIAGSSMRGIYNLKTRLSAAFKMKDLCPVKQILGMKISRDRSAGT